MKAQSDAGEGWCGEGLGRVGCVEDDDNVSEWVASRAKCAWCGGGQLHDDKAGCLRGAGVEEAQMVLDVREGGHAEEIGTFANAEEILEGCSCGLDLGWGGFEGGVGKQGLLEGPLVFVLAGEG